MVLRTRAPGPAPSSCVILVKLHELSELHCSLVSSGVIVTGSWARSKLMHIENFT